jgi:hypothetical protein
MSNPSIPHRRSLFRERSRPTRAAGVELYEGQNRGCAEIILNTPERYGGDGSLMATWAQAVPCESEPRPAMWRLVA